MKFSGPIVITGFMGCGKTEIARALAVHLDISMIDLDEEITRKTGRTPAALIEEDGERAFRSIESSVLNEVLAAASIEVIALGGGAWIEGPNRQAIARHDGVTVWLDTGFEMCWQRIETSNEVRPLGRSREVALKLYEARKPVYQLAPIRLTTAIEDTPAELALRIESALNDHLSSLRPRG